MASSGNASGAELHDDRLPVHPARRRAAGHGLGQHGDRAAPRAVEPPRDGPAAARASPTGSPRWTWTRWSRPWTRSSPGRLAAAGWSASRPAATRSSIARPGARLADGQSSSPRSWASARSRGSRAVAASYGAAAIAASSVELARVDPPRQRRQRPERLQRRLHEPATGVVAVARDDDRPLTAEAEHRLDGGRPVDRVSVAEVGRRAVLEEVAGAQDVRVGDPEHDVVVGVAATEVVEPDLAPADPDRRGSVNVRSGGSSSTSARSAASSGTSAAARARCASPRPLDHRHAALVAPDGRRPEHAVAERVVVVAVGVDDDRDPRRAELTQVVHDLAGLRVRASGCPRRAPRRGPAPPRCSGRRTRSAARTPGRRSRSSAVSSPHRSRGPRETATLARPGARP